MIRGLVNAYIVLGGVWLILVGFGVHPNWMVLGGVGLLAGIVGSFIEAVRLR